ncbi:hypothetical protein Q9R19_00800 [Microbacterium sp. ARD32]|uniref:hypothetical protein n=1 Tax=Microbacterium sp. ARD32 TaxID=2962577 RepID=UPI0028823BED|nr:hypothetical protein [Microbacterium sp. ARD32]MDT0156156.1 hypothetical protein [Microbacterium sp. ARD32]
MIRREPVVVLLLTGALLTACTPAPSAPRASDPVSSAAPATSAPDPDAIRDVDFGSLTFTWDTLGVQYPVKLSDGAAQVEDPYYQQTATFRLGEPTYSDANGDGLIDAAVPLQFEAGNGIMKNWFLWLAQPDAPDAPQQIVFPIASGARCADAVSGVEAIDGGFRVHEVMRDAIESTAACAQVGTMERTRDIGAEGDGTADGSWPVTLDGEGFGGYCPVKVITEGERAPAQGRVGPSDAAPQTSASGEKLFTPIQHYPFLQPEGWMLTGFLPDEPVDDSVVCVWVEKS